MRTRRTCRRWLTRRWLSRRLSDGCWKNRRSCFRRNCRQTRRWKNRHRSHHLPSLGRRPTKRSGRLPMRRPSRKGLADGSTIGNAWLVPWLKDRLILRIDSKLGAVSPNASLLLYPKPDRQGRVSELNDYTKIFSPFRKDSITGNEYIEFRAEPFQVSASVSCHTTFLEPARPEGDPDVDEYPAAAIRPRASSR